MRSGIISGPSLKERTTLRLGGQALAEVLIRDTQDLERLPETLRSLGGAPYVLGRGSNVLARDGELPLVLLRLQQPPKPLLLTRDTAGAIVQAPAGMSLPRLLHWLAARGLAGLEGLSGVPGTVGGAVAMNAGSFGSETSRCLQRVQVVTREGQQWVNRDGFTTGYRHFSLLRKSEAAESADFTLITAAEFRLAGADPDKVKARMKEYLTKKRTSQPITAWTAGCAFKNPAPEAPAGMLLERAGFRGFGLGGMVFSERHANFLENTGHGTSEAALELLDLAQRRVREQSGHELQLEVTLCPPTL